MTTESDTAPAVVGTGEEAGRGAPRGARLGSLFWILAAVSAAGFGMGAVTFRYAEGFSYLSSEPEVCINCHIMQPQYDGWQKASHHAVARCVDCHLPEALLAKYVAKAENGYRHAKEFTAGTFAEPITIQARGRQILQDNCVRCHADLVAELNQGSPDGPGQVECVHCHATVGHGEKAGLGGPRRQAAAEATTVSEQDSER